MMNGPEDVPILILAWRRKDHIADLMKALRIVRPTKLYISLDGPRLEESTDYSDINDVYSLICTEIDWACAINAVIMLENLGSGLAIQTAIDWFFEFEESGIVLEDDVIPDPTFFRFVYELLNFYRDDLRVGAICASNLVEISNPDGNSYLFSRMPYVFWGWATWRNRWSFYHVSLNQWSSINSKEYFMNIYANRSFVKRWQNEVNSCIADPSIAWDYLWQNTVWMQNFLCVIPYRPLAKNVGFGPSATHTFERASLMPKSFPLTFPIQHPSYTTPNSAHERVMLRVYFCSTVFKRLVAAVRRLVIGIIRRP